MNPSDLLRKTVPASATAQMKATQLPLLPDHMRALSHPIARSALFSIGNRNKVRPNLKRQMIAALNGIMIEYTGEQLYQDDHDVFMQVCHIARNTALGQPVRFSAYSIIKRLGWTQTTASYTRLAACLDRLKATSLSLTFELPNNGGRVNYSGSLVRSFRWREDATGERMREWEILLEVEIIALFPTDAYSAIEWEVHRKLAPVSKWLHNFYSTHQYAYPYSVQRLRELMKSKAGTLRQFRATLKENLQALIDAGFLMTFEITEDDFVQVIRVGYEDPDRLHFVKRLETAV